ncbi:MAG: hypothetical protein H0W20_04275 [Chthoniobacterales bacterium]|nr:hypothetical protein [Chthoniobacterales bacterium]
MFTFIRNTALVGRQTLINSLAEATELIEIHEGLKDRTDSELPDLLQKFISGTPLRADEAPGKSKARNTGFHLWFAAAAARCGLKIDLTSPGDVGITWGEGRIAAECKRLLGARKVDGRISKGFRQLKRTYSGGTVASSLYGLLAITISKLYPLPLEVADEAELRERGEENFVRFVSEYQGSWKKRVTGREIALFLHWTSPVIVRKPYLVVVATDFRFIPLHSGSKAEDYYFRAIQDRFHRLVPTEPGASIYLP